MDSRLICCFFDEMSHEPKHVYQNHLLDSTRWNLIKPRDGDIVIATPYKCGTTWIQNIVLHLIFQDLETRAIGDYSPWIDFRIRPLDDMMNILNSQKHRRCMKSHLPFDGLRYFDQMQYVVVGRDPRDVFMSLWNHYRAYTPEFIAATNETPDRVGPPMPVCPDDIHEFWDQWINRGWFDWETEGYPHWSNLRHVQTWWDCRHFENILFVHFNDLLADLPGEIRRLADYLKISCSDDMARSIAELTTFASMKRDAERLGPKKGARFKGGAKTFINKGTNGRWRSVLSADELKMYDDAVARELTPDCHTWIENGVGGY